MKAAEKKGKPAVGQALDENYKYKYEKMRTTNTNMKNNIWMCHQHKGNTIWV